MTQRARDIGGRDGERLSEAEGPPDAPGSLRVYENVLSHLHQQIEDGVLRPGEKLPSERKLAEHFEVGRSSVRDAIRILQARGIVKPRQGGGTVVQAFSSDTLVAELAGALVRKRALVHELMDVRCMIEPPVAGRAAAHATPEQIEHLEDILRRQHRKVSRGERAIEEDTEFHSAIARAAGNPVMLAVVDTLVNLLAETRGRLLQGGERAQASLDGHRLVLRAIRRRRPSAAEAAMRRHIRSVEAIILRRPGMKAKRST
ncbi:MAG TPA: FadR/GntR family transcriptional regulator [Anaeromyxobacteraceae bacterium]|nr:FadR/GntR family transcriptional regulator [Anaeromyxobacteraceae bacterium]